MFEIKYTIENQDFNIEKIMKSGQNFTYTENDGIFSFIVNKQNILCYTENNKTYFSIDEDFFKENLYKLFDMQTDYENIRNQINKKFPELKQYTEYGKGLRFISQDFLEVAIIFIFSQNNNIKRIMKSAELLKNNYGSGNFPTLDTLKKISIEEFRNLGIGFRDKYVYNFVQNIDEKWIENIKKMNTKNAFAELTSFYGIGPKVANCILLFGLNKRDVFPVDTHIKQIMQKLYFNNKDTKIEKIEQFAINKYGELASYIQQYLFYWKINQKNILKGDTKI